MPGNTDSQRRKIRESVFSAVFHCILFLLTSWILLAVRQHFAMPDWAQWLLLGMALCNLGLIVPVFILLKTRIKEIQGGEEDAAAQY